MCMWRTSRCHSITCNTPLGLSGTGNAGTCLQIAAAAFYKREKSKSLRDVANAGAGVTRLHTSPYQCVPGGPPGPQGAGGSLWPLHGNTEVSLLTQLDKLRRGMVKARVQITAGTERSKLWRTAVLRVHRPFCLSPGTHCSALLKSLLSALSSQSQLTGVSSPGAAVVRLCQGSDALRMQPAVPGHTPAWRWKGSAGGALALTKPFQWVLVSSVKKSVKCSWNPCVSLILCFI